MYPVTSFSVYTESLLGGIIFILMAEKETEAHFASPKIALESESHAQMPWVSEET